MPINKPLIIPLAALLTVAITLTAVTAAVLSTQPTTPNYIPPAKTINGPTSQDNTDPNNTETNDQQNTVTGTNNQSNQNITINATPSPTTNGNNQNSHSQTDSNNQQNTITSTLNLAIYEDGNAITTCDNIIWGTLHPGDEATKTIYIKNTGNTAATLSMTASSWTPTDASDKLTLTWNKQGSTIAAGAMVAAILTLKVAADTGDLTDFSMNIVISVSTQ
ncbi:MAG: hypothetical protein M1540_01080 [Candidatus Bathyarchaeota archaeon]|nr:hypothetical protein [Chloroflexota bacterium]MCL5876389.1 hypothetical protein [Candidatus Bathyarchaeota archaeon]